LWPALRGKDLMHAPQALPGQRLFQHIAAPMACLASYLTLLIANATADARSAPHIDWSKPKIMRVLLPEMRRS